MTPHARLVAAIEALATKRAMDPLKHLDVVSSAEFLALVAAPTRRLTAAGFRRGYRVVARG